MAKYLKTSQANVKNILDILEKTHLIFSIESYGTSSKRMKKPKNIILQQVALEMHYPKTLEIQLMI